MNFTKLGNTPVDIAGSSNLPNVVEVFCEHLASRINGTQSNVAAIDQDDEHVGASMTDGDGSQVINDNSIVNRKSTQSLIKRMSTKAINNKYA